MPSPHMQQLLDSMNQHFLNVSGAINSNAARQSESLTIALAAISSELVDQIKALTVGATSWVAENVANTCKAEHDEATVLYAAAKTMPKLAAATFESRDALGRTAPLAAASVA